MRVGVMRGGSCAALRASGRRPGAEHRPGGLGFGTRWRRRRFWSCRRAAAWSSGAAARPSGALHTSGAWSAGASFGASVAKPSCGCQSAVSHVIPLRLVQILNSCRWNCNVFEVSRKMTELNYVRNLSGGGVAVARVRLGPCALQPGLPVSPAPQPGPLAPFAPVGPSRLMLLGALP